MMRRQEINPGMDQIGILYFRCSEIFRWNTSIYGSQYRRKPSVSTRLSVGSSVSTEGREQDDLRRESSYSCSDGFGSCFRDVNSRRSVTGCSIFRKGVAVLDYMAMCIGTCEILGVNVTETKRGYAGRNLRRSIGTIKQRYTSCRPARTMPEVCCVEKQEKTIPVFGVS